MLPEEFLRASGEQDLTGLICDRLCRRPEVCDWPEDIREALARETRAQTARELLRQNELISVLDVLAADGIDPILLKGTALAYSLYDNPASRPRVDTDLLIRGNDVDHVRRAMARHGYVAPTHCDGAVAKQVSPVCAHQLSAARRWFGTRVPDQALTALGAFPAHEPSTAYL
jgi:putative nucleotidyltransferase-like protein